MSSIDRINYDRESFILIVDDDPTLLKFFKIHLNKYFSKVIVVKNAKEAIDTIADKKIDLVLSDVRMPKVDGVQLLKKIRSHDPLIPLYLVSGEFLDEEKLEQVKSVSDGFLRKPFGIDEIHKLVSEGLKRREQLLALAEIVSKPAEALLVLDKPTQGAAKKYLALPEVQAIIQGQLPAKIA